MTPRTGITPFGVLVVTPRLDCNGAAIEATKLSAGAQLQTLSAVAARHDVSVSAHFATFSVMFRIGPGIDQSREQHGPGKHLPQRRRPQPGHSRVSYFQQVGHWRSALA